MTDELKVKDLKCEGKGLFHYINLEVDLIPDNDILDMGFYLLHGEKLLNPFIKDKIKDGVTDDVMKMLGNIINNLYSEKWKKIIDLYKNELDIETYKLTTTELIDEIGKNENTSTNTSSNERERKVAAFDEDGFSDDNKETNKGNTNIKNVGDSTKNKTVTRNVSGNLKNKLDDIEKIKQILKENVIYDIIYIDVSQLVGLQIY